MTKRPKRDLTGQRFGRLVVVSFVDKKGSHARWRVCCDCGTEKTLIGGSFTQGRTQSCGCYRRERLCKNADAPHKKDPLYTVWRGIIQRCTDKNNKRWGSYGGRGITVCKEWLDFGVFRRDMAPRPDGAQIDRINNNVGYSKSNCKWVTSKENCRNRRSNVLVEYDGRTMTVSEAAELSGIPRLRIYQRLARNCKDVFAPVESKYRPRNLRSDNAGRWVNNGTTVAATEGGAA
jgi:hypothetical protein